MRAIRRLSSPGGITTLVVIALLTLSVAESARGGEQPSSITIRNFGRVNGNLYRGAQPKGGDYSRLAAMGIKTVLDLQREGEEDEQRLVEAAGMKFFRIPMSDRSQPEPEAAEEFLRLVSDPVNQPIFIHCRGGRHRTGAMAAVYRMTQDSWTADQAYEEMKRYQFKKGMGHGAMKDFVYEYYGRMINAEVKD